MQTVHDMPVYRARSGRVAYFDNAKLILMACVVTGHMLKCGGAPRRRFARALFALIYAFHMPLFIFVSGLFCSRQALRRDEVARRVATFLALGLIAKLLRGASSWVWGRAFACTPFVEAGLPWFMFALAAYHALAWLLRRADALVVLVASLALSLAAGYVTFIGDFLCLSRIIVFFPFFWVGHMLTPTQVRCFFGMPVVRGACAAVLVVCACVCLRWTHPFYMMRRLFMGRLCYAKTRIAGCSAAHRLLAYLLSVLLGTAVLGVIPHRRLAFFTDAGRRTLQVYLLHLEVIDVLRRMRVTRALVRTGRWGWLLLVAVGVVLTLALAAPDLTRLRPGGRPAGRAKNRAPVRS